MPTRRIWRTRASSSLDSSYLKIQQLSNEIEKLKQENLHQLEKENKGQQKVLRNRKVYASRCSFTCTAKRS
jgi:hypothetical protein